MADGTPTNLDVSDIDWKGVAVLNAPVSPSRIQAELATLPERRTPARGATMLTYNQAAAELGVSRGMVLKFVKAGKLHDRGREATDGLRFERSEVDELVAERETERFERQATGPVREQRSLEREQGISHDPRTTEKQARASDGNSEAQQRHFEMMRALQDLKAAVEMQTDRIVAVMSSQKHHLAAVQESLSTLNTGLLVAAGAVVGNAVIPEEVKADWREKISAPFRAKADVPVVAAPESPAGVRVASGEATQKRVPVDPKIAAIAEAFDSMLDEERATAKP